MSCRSCRAASTGQPSCSDERILERRTVEEAHQIGFIRVGEGILADTAQVLGALTYASTRDKDPWDEGHRHKSCGTAYR